MLVNPGRNLMCKAKQKGLHTSIFALFAIFNGYCTQQRTFEGCNSYLVTTINVQPKADLYLLSFKMAFS